MLESVSRRPTGKERRCSSTRTLGASGARVDPIRGLCHDMRHRSRPSSSSPRPPAATRSAGSSRSPTRPSGWPASWTTCSRRGRRRHRPGRRDGLRHAGRRRRGPDRLPVGPRLGRRGDGDRPTGRAHPGHSCLVDNAVRAAGTTGPSSSRCGPTRRARSRWPCVTTAPDWARWRPARRWGSPSPARWSAPSTDPWTCARASRAGWWPPSACAALGPGRRLVRIVSDDHVLLMEAMGIAFADHGHEVVATGRP